MDRLKKLQDSERELEQQLKVVQSLKQHATLMNEVAFEAKLEALMTRYQKTLSDIMLLEASTSAPDQLH